MCGKCHLNTWRRTVGVGALVIYFAHASFADPDSNTNVIEKPLQQLLAAEDKQILPEIESSGAINRSVPDLGGKTAGLPTTDQLVEAKLSALKQKQAEQETTLADAEFKLLKEEGKGQHIFDSQAYLSLSIKNTAPPVDYRLERTDIYVDGKLIARGGKRNQGLPRKADFFFGPVEPGCHEILVKARYVRLKNDLISRFKVDRIEHATRRLTVMARKDYRLDVEIEGYEAHNTFANFYRGPAIRFNKSARPNFLPGAPLVSLDEIFKQGRVYIDYITEDQSQHRLIEKSVSIDGLPVLVKEKHDVAKDKSIVFDAPLSEGRHTLGVTLLFGEQPWVGGGPLYNFRMMFNRDFYVISGQTTVVNLTGMPKGGFRNSAQDSRYARATSKILSTENEEFFPESTCQEIQTKERAEQKKQQEDLAKSKPKEQAKPVVVPQKPVEPVEPKKESTEGEPASGAVGE